MPKPEGSSTQQNVAMILAVFVEAANFFRSFVRTMTASCQKSEGN